MKMCIELFGLKEQNWGWIYVDLRPSSFRVISLSESQMQASIVILTNKSKKSTVEISSITIVKVEPTVDSVFMLLDSDYDICAFFDL